MELVKEFGFHHNTGVARSIIDFAINGVKHSSADVRNNAYALLVEIYKVIGNKINGYLEELRPA